jgi:hypothetical protein
MSRSYDLGRFRPCVPLSPSAFPMSKVVFHSRPVLALDGLPTVSSPDEGFREAERACLRPTGPAYAPVRGDERLQRDYFSGSEEAVTMAEQHPVHALRAELQATRLRMVEALAATSAPYSPDTLHQLASIQAALTAVNEAIETEGPTVGWGSGEGLE